MSRVKNINSMKLLIIILIVCIINTKANVMSISLESKPQKNAYATILYMGTPHDYEFYMATRVLFQSLIKLKSNGDLIVIASPTVPQKWIKTLKNEDIIVKVIENISNPYTKNPKFEKRFGFTLNKIYAWTLTDYERVIMLDVDNVFLRAPNELFQCGEFCAVFINPCIFHTGLFVLKPSNKTFDNMLYQILNKTPNKDGADQGFLTSYYSDLLDRSLFHPPIDGAERLTGLYRLPESYQRDAALYYLNLKWHAPCGLNSAITFPSIPMLKPWFWWSYPILPLGILWHEKRLATIGYYPDIYILIIELSFYFIILFITLLIQSRSGQKLMEKNGLTKICLTCSHCSCHLIVSKLTLIATLILSYVLPFILIPTMVHPIFGWGMFFFGSFVLLYVTVIMFQLPIFSVMIPWLESLGMLLIMFWPYHSSGISRSLIMTTYACLLSPSLWWCFKKLFILHEESKNQEPLMSWTTLKSNVLMESSKSC